MPCKRKVIASIGTGVKDGCELRNELVRATVLLASESPIIYFKKKKKKKGIVMS